MGLTLAFPFENPTVFSKFIENLAILLIPVALIVAFGLFVKNAKQGRTIFIVSLGTFRFGFSGRNHERKVILDLVIQELLKMGLEGKKPVLALDGRVFGRLAIQHF
ncbi:potassium-transporting ATPase subunit KdpA [Carnobacterium maltaromaticum]